MTRDAVSMLSLFYMSCIVPTSNLGKKTNYTTVRHFVLKKIQS